MKTLALKIDVDTYRGTLEGVPRLVDLLGKHGLRATFFFSLGPDTSGRAIKRLFRKGFVKKVLSAKPAASYGLRTMLYGTLLPAPDIGGRSETVRRMRETIAAGHAVGIHAWDHVEWHDSLTRMSRLDIETVVAREHARFREIFGEPAAFQAAPGWTATPLSVEVQEGHGLLATSDTRGGEPFYAIRADGMPSRVLEIPTTLPTLDELLAVSLPGRGSQRQRVCEFLRTKMREDPPASTGGAGLHVHSLHTEIEGASSFCDWFEEQLKGWKSDGVAFLTFDEVCRALKFAESHPGTAREQIEIPVKRLAFTTVPGRATPVATGIAPLPG